MVDGLEEWPVEGIIDERRCGRGMRYLVRLVDQPPSEDCWLPGSLLQENEALDRWLASRSSGTNDGSWCWQPFTLPPPWPFFPFLPYHSSCRYRLLFPELGFNAPK